MSKVSKEKIDIKKLKSYNIENGNITVEGTLGSNTVNIPSFLTIKINTVSKFFEVDYIEKENKKKTKKEAAMHGTLVRLIKNAVIGVTEGFKKIFLLKGLGYKYILDKKSNVLTFSLGYSHPVLFALPADIQPVEHKYDKLELKAINKELLGKIANSIINLRKWNPYSTKGIMEENTIPYTKAVVKAKK